MVHGRSGSGKSALMAKMAEELQGRGATLMTRFIGATPASTQVHSLLPSLCEQVHRAFDSHFQALMARELEEHEARTRQKIEAAANEEKRQQLRADAEEGRRTIEERYQVPGDPKELARAFERFLGFVPDDRQLVIVLDALDQLSPDNSAHSLDWLSWELPTSVRIVASGAARVAAGRRAPIEDAVRAGQVLQGARRVTSPSAEWVWCPD